MEKIGISRSLTALMALAANYGSPIRLTQEGPGVKDWRKGWHKGGNFDSRINRHTGKPHEHRCEKARRLRQAAQRTS